MSDMKTESAIIIIDFICILPTDLYIYLLKEKYLNF